MRREPENFVGLADMPCIVGHSIECVAGNGRNHEVSGVIAFRSVAQD